MVGEDDEGIVVLASLLLLLGALVPLVLILNKSTFNK